MTYDDRDRKEGTSKDTIRANTLIHGRFAIYTGDLDQIRNGWSMNEKWVVKTYDKYNKDHAEHHDAKTIYDTDIEIKGTNIGEESRPGDIVIHESAHKRLLRESVQPNPNDYHCTVHQWLNPTTLHVVDDVTVAAEVMDALVGDTPDEYSWSPYQREGVDPRPRRAAHVPWPAVPGFDEDEVRETARIVRDLVGQGDED